MSEKSKRGDPIICRCNDVTESEIVEVIRKGFTDSHPLYPSPSRWREKQRSER